MTVPESEWAQAIEAIRGAEHAALACHLGPDGDALGSMLATALIFERLGIKTTPSWGGEPFAPPKQYSFLPALDRLVPPSEFPAEPALMLTFDAGSYDRLGSLEPNARRAARLVVVDHHVSNDHFGHVNLIDGDAAASAVLAYELARRLEVQLDTEIATCLYTGLVTDTGSFKYRNTTPAIHQIAADLLRFDIRHDEIVRIVYDTHPVGYLKLAGVALGRAVIVGRDPAMIHTFITQDDLRAHEIELEDTEALIDAIRTADTAEVACVLKQIEDGRFKVSLRSKGAVDVGAVAQAFGGGGHMFAAGFTSETDPAATIDRIAELLPGALIA